MISQDTRLEIRRLYGTYKDENLATKLGITVEDVEAVATEFSLGKDKRLFECKRMPRWTRAEMDLLEEYYPHHSNVEVARIIGRSLKSVSAKAHNEGLTKSEGRIITMGQENVSKRRDRQ